MLIILVCVGFMASAYTQDAAIGKLLIAAALTLFSWRSHEFKWWQLLVAFAIGLAAGALIGWAVPTTATASNALVKEITGKALQEHIINALLAGFLLAYLYDGIGFNRSVLYAVPAILIAFIGEFALLSSVGIGNYLIRALLKSGIETAAQKAIKLWPILVVLTGNIAGCAVSNMLQHKRFYHPAYPPQPDK